MLKRFFILILIFGAVLSASAQVEYQDIRAGNKAYEKEEYIDAEVAYRKALQKNPNSFEAIYNLGNALFKQEKYAEALEQYQVATPMDNLSKKKLAAALHNTGNALLMQEKIAESISAYQNSLKANPKDDETRYNLALAQQLLQNPPPEEQQQQQDDQEQPQQEPEQQEDDSQQNEEEQESNMSKEQAEQMLDALMQDEDETMEKAKQQPHGQKKRVEKDW